MIPLIAFAVLVSQAASDPNNLQIGKSGTISVQPGQIMDLRSGKEATLANLIDAAGRARFVYLGEQHATTAHQQMEADVIDALDKAGRSVAVGLEMYTRPKQDFLDQWSSGALNEADFLEQSDWKHQWGFDFAFYRPVFMAVQEHHLPFLALNVPRDWVSKVGKGGYAALPTSAKLQLPPQMFLGNADHRSIFNALMGGHPGMAPGQMENIYAAQVLWDEGMADTALKFVTMTPGGDNPVFVVIAGAGHVMYGQGINYRVARHKGGPGLNVVMLSSDGPVTVSRGLADFVYVSKAPPTK